MQSFKGTVDIMQSFKGTVDIMQSFNGTVDIISIHDSPFIKITYSYRFKKCREPDRPLFSNKGTLEIKRTVPLNAIWGGDMNLEKRKLKFHRNVVNMTLTSINLNRECFILVNSILKIFKHLFKPSYLNLLAIISFNSGNSFVAKRTGAVASPSSRSAAAGFPSCSDEETKSRRSSTSWNAIPTCFP